MDQNTLASLCKRIRYDILTATTIAGSGHPTSSLSAVELMATLFFGGFLRQDTTDFKSISNDRVIFSKGHAAPLLYSLYETAGVITQKELLTLRKFGSRLQGHPTPDLPFVDVATGSLGQGLSVGLGMALGIRLNVTRYMLHVMREPTVWILMGDSEVAEGQVWEAMEIASKYNLNNLVGILDINRLGQSGETELSWDIRTYEARIKSFGWDTIVINNGHNLEEVKKAFEAVNGLNTIKKQKPMMILARNVKGKGVSFLEDKEGWHGKVLSKEQLKTALKELGKVNLTLKGEIKKPSGVIARKPTLRRLTWQSHSFTGLLPFRQAQGRNDKLESVLNKLAISAHIKTTLQNTLYVTRYTLHDKIATREAFGDSLLELGKTNGRIVVLDAEVGNSTYVNKFSKEYPDRFFQMYISEENMVSVALGLSKMGFIPYLSTFAAFLTRAFDQIRMCQYSIVKNSCKQLKVVESSCKWLKVVKNSKGKNLISTAFNYFQPIPTINIVGSHAGVSIGPDGPSQMGLEDIAMMRSIDHSTILYPSDAVSAAKLTKIMATNPGINYLRTTRGVTPVIYDEKEEFRIGGLKIHYPTHKTCSMKHVTSEQKKLHATCCVLHAVIIAAGITVHEALKAQKLLSDKNIYVIVVDLYSIKPLDVQSIKRLITMTKHVIVVEDHYEAGGIGEAVLSALFSKYQLSITNFQSNSKNSIFKKEIDNWKLKIENFTHLCVRKTPCSGTPEKLLHYEEIDARAIEQTISNLVG